MGDDLLLDFLVEEGREEDYALPILEEDDDDYDFGLYDCGCCKCCGCSCDWD